MSETAQVVYATSYFPPLDYMASVMRHPAIAIEQQESFPKQTYRNRTVIVTANGPMVLSVPVIRPEGSHTRTSDIGISYTERWNVLHLRALDAAYNASPYYLYYRDEIEKILLSHHKRLIDLNNELFLFLLQSLKITCRHHYTDDYLHTEKWDHDYRQEFSYKHPNPFTHHPVYPQVFGTSESFNPHVGIIDLLFNLGPEAKSYLQKIEC